MASPLLATQLRIPPQPHHVVTRQRLIDRLEQDLRGYKLMLLAAPAGFGKTTLLAQWARSSDLAVAWISLSEEANDFERFFRSLLAAWESVRPAIRESDLGMLRGAMLPDSKPLLSTLINVASGVPDHTVFVLDDYHLIEDESIHEALTFLLDHLPSTLHFVLASRREPPLPLARYRVRHELLELRAEDLHFSLEETTAFLNRLIDLDLPSDAIAGLHGNLEGWAAGLQLVALTLQQGRRPARELAITGKHRFIADYLSEEVLTYLPDDMQQFLLRTSILDRLCGPLCDTVTGAEDGQAMLERLERENLFLVPLDDNREWFRYHRLFADFLQAVLHRRHPDEVAPLHRRAARWHLAHDLPEQAFRHALAAHEAELVAQIYEKYFEIKLLSGEFMVLKRWIESLPEQWRYDYPLIGLFQGALLLFTGALDAGTRYIDNLEQELAQVAHTDKQRSMARVSVVRCAVACFQNDLTHAERYADRAFRELPEEDHTFRATLHHTLGDTYRANGRWEEARASYLKLFDFPHVPAFAVRSVHAFGALADLDLRQGHLQDAAGNWRKALAAIREPASPGAFPLPLIGWVYIRMGELLYERNELAEARDHLSQGLKRVEMGGDVRAMIAGYLLATRLQLTEGDVEAAEASLERARPLVESAHFSDWTARFYRLQVELWLAQDRGRTAASWVGGMVESGQLEDQPENEEAYLSMARVLIVSGDVPSLDRALELLAELREAAEAEGRLGILITTLALQAIGYRQRGESAGAITSLERALRLAEPEGYVRLFADLGLPMARLLQEARSRDLLRDYSERLLAAFGGDLAFPPPAQKSLPEPLSAREQEVLELLAAGLTNREIAEALFISPETVKKHTGNIYTKLSVRNRREAAARARELALLDQSSTNR